MNQNLNKALEYAAKGWSVIPLFGKKPPKGFNWKPFQERIATVDEIRQWWEQRPSANVGIVLGQVSNGLAVVDVDDATLAERLIRELSDKTTLIRSPRGGVHIYLTESVQSGNINFRSFGVEADLKGNGGYVVAPPSKGYTVIANGQVLCVANALETARELLPIKAVERQVTDDSSGEEVFKKGDRNNGLLTKAHALVSRGLSSDELKAALHRVNDQQCVPPLGKVEVETIASHVLEHRSQGFNASSKDHTKERIELLTTGEWSKRDPVKELEWIWQGYLAKEVVTLLAGHPKVGKTTFVHHLLKAIGSGEKTFLGTDLKPIKKVLYLTQEGYSLFLDRCQRMAIDNQLIIPVFKYRVKSDWKSLLRYLGTQIKEKEVSLVVVDTIGSFWGIQDENSAAEVIQAIRPLCDFAQEHKVAVLVVHHFRKAAGEKGIAVRGSNGLSSEMDITVELRPSGNNGNRRQLATDTRAEGRSKDVLIELEEDGYRLLGDSKDLSFEVLKEKILDAVPPCEHEEPQAIREGISDPKPSIKMVKEILAELFKEGKVNRQGKGVKGDPYLYQKIS